MTEAAVAGAAEAPPAEAEPSLPPRLPRAMRHAGRLADLIKVGSLTLEFPGGASHRATASDAPAATVVVKHRGAVRRLLAGRPLGLAEAYIDGWWTSPDLREVMALALANEADWGEGIRARAWLRVWARLRDRLHRLRPAALLAGRRDVDRYYQLAGDFYSCWLDATMTQSAAIFGGNDPSLEAAQLRKVHRICRLLRLVPGIRVLDLSCGWGSFAEIAARDYGCSVLAITTSRFHFDYTAQRIGHAGLNHRVEVRMLGFRDLTGRFDRIVGIETFDTVPEEEWPLYCKTIRDLLGNSGVAALQFATISDRLFEAHRRGDEFITRFIAPNRLLPTRSRLRRNFQKAGMAWGEEQWFGRDYAETMSRWYTAFQSAWPRIAAVTRGNRHPCDERFKRLWEFYLAYCELAFRAGWMDVGQILIAPNG